MHCPIFRSAWITLLTLSAACSGRPDAQSPWAAAPGSSTPAASGDGSGGNSSGAPAAAGGSSGGGSGATGAASGDSLGGSGAPATGSSLAGSVDGGTVAGGSGGTATSGSISTSAGPSPGGATAPDVFAGAPPFVPQVGNSAHNPGQSCMKSGCHGPGGGETSFLIGGTVYKDYQGTIPAAGVEIRVKDMAGNAVSVYSGMNGNFYIRSNGGGVTLPAIVSARDGTTTRPMITPLTTNGFNVGVGTMGSCASAGCHITGTGGTAGGPVSGAYYPIHVP